MIDEIVTTNKKFPDKKINQVIKQKTHIKKILFLIYTKLSAVLNIFIFFLNHLRFITISADAHVSKAYVFV